MDEEESLICAALTTLPATATGEMMYMPGGVQTITPIAGGIKKPIKVLVDAQGAAELQRQLSALIAKGKPPYFDFGHEDGPASFWPREFYWQADGIYARGEWTGSGKAGVDGREWRQFSPVFHVDNKSADPARIVCREWAKPNMGGLVNDPAFHNISPLWAKNAPGAQPNPEATNTVTNMTPEELAALQARNKELTDELSALKAKDQNDAAIAAALKAKQNELDLNASQLELAALKAKNAKQDDAIKARNKADAEIVVAAAVARGAIAAKDTKTSEALVARATEDPGFCDVIKAMQGNAALGGRVTPSGNVQVSAESPNAVMKEFAELVCRNAAIPLSSETHKAKGKIALETAALFAREINTSPTIIDMPIEDAIKAADNTNATVGLLSGTLVMQRALPLLQFEFPILSSITNDFSDEVGVYGQTQSTRIILKPAVQTRSTAVDSAGRPLGWTTVSPAQMVDVPVTLDEHIGIPTVFGQNILASTVRNLFNEQAPMAIYALGEYLVNKLTGIFTPANFNAYAGNTLAAGAVTNGSTAVTVTSTANAFPGQSISGTGIPANAYVRTVTSGTTLELTQPATATATGLTLTINGTKVPVPYATYAKALASFNMSALADIKAAFSNNEVPQDGRFALLNSSYWAKLSQDGNFNTFFAATRKPEIITEGALPRLQGFNPLEAPWFPTSGNRVGFAGHRASAILKTRLPNDFTSAVDAMAPGSVTTVTTPGGISVLLVQYVSMREGYAEWRPEIMAGVAVGDRRAGLVITSS